MSAQSTEKMGVDDFLATKGTLDDLNSGLISLADWRAAHPDLAHGRASSKATRIVALAVAAGDELFHDEQDEPWVTATVDGHKETHRLRSKQYKLLLGQRYFQVEKAAPDSKAVQDALSVLDGLAVFDGPAHRVYTRVAEHDGLIYIDLADDTWRGIRIVQGGWMMDANLPVKFRRARGMKPLPEPKRRGSIKKLRPYVNIADEDDWRLFVSWLVTSFFPNGPYPVLVINGPQGSAKSTLVKVLRLLLDPNSSSLRAEPRELRDLMIAATNSWVVSFDNLSHLKPDLSDAICRLATGGGFGTRELYTDGEEIIFDAQRPVTLNGIGDLATRGDLLDRSILITLPVIPDDKRKTEKAFWKAFEADRPGILGALLNAFSWSFWNQSHVRLPAKPRMADFAVRAAAAAPALGWTVKDFLSAYDDNRDTGHAVALEASPIPELLRALVNDRPWTGTAAELLDRLNKLKGDLRPTGRGWPATPKALSEAVRRLAPNLPVLGLQADFYKEPNRSRRRLISIWRPDRDPPPKDGKRPSASSKPVEGVDAGWTQDSAAASTPSTLVVDGVDGVDAEKPSLGGTDSIDDDSIQGSLSSPSSPPAASAASSLSSVGPPPALPTSSRSRGRSASASDHSPINGNLRPHRPHRPPLEGRTVDAAPRGASTSSSPASTPVPIPALMFSRAFWTGWEGVAVSLLREMPGLTPKGPNLNRQQLLVLLKVNCQHVADSRTGPSRSLPSDELLGQVVDRLVADGLLAIHAVGKGKDDVYRWTPAALADLDAGAQSS